MRRTLWLPALAALVACGDDPPTRSPFGLDVRPSNTTCLAQDRPVLETGVKLERQWTNLTFQAPMFLLQAPGDATRWYVVQRGSNATPGTVRTFPATATTNAQVTEFASVPINDGGSEGGLLGMAFHPSWPAKHEAYLSFTRLPATGDPAPICPATRDHVVTSIIARMTSRDGTRLDGPPDEILKVGQPYGNHKGGTINFHPSDGYLYFGLGDGGSGDDPCNSGQNLQSLLGKILRIDVNAPAGKYNVPADNPFVGRAALPEIWSYGHRNPFRWSFDQATGELWLGEVGQDRWEEVDRVVGGGNYGWNTCEGLHRRGSTTQLCNTPGLIDPIVEHPRSEAASITGGYVYRGAAMPSLVGTYIYGDYITGNIWALTYDASNKPVPKLITSVARSSLVAFGQGHDGEIYTVQITGIISKLVPSAVAATDRFPQLLSATGCVDPSDPTRPAAGLIPYDVASPLWSDGAAKERYLAIPDDKTITITADDDWDLPIGSVAMKTFAVGDKRIETRLFMRHADGGWGGYTYEWNERGTDATLLPAGKNRAIDDSQLWAYPSRSQCLQCHSMAAGGTIGLETAQLNRDGVYASTNRLSNQLATLDHIGLFSQPLAQPPEALARLSEPEGNDALELRARAYLHANCAHCHRPDGGGQGTMDLRYARSLAETVTCNATNTQGAIGDATQLVVPGDPARSLLSIRMHATDAKRMPPVAVSVIDEAGAKVVDDWIASLTACPQ